jgi:hypothetical protein
LGILLCESKTKNSKTAELGKERIIGKILITM